MNCVVRILQCFISILCTAQLLLSNVTELERTVVDLIAIDVVLAPVVRFAAPFLQAIMFAMYLKTAH